MGSQKLFLVAAIMALGLVFSTDALFGRGYMDCGGVRIFGNTENKLCCGRTNYDIRTQMCCNGQKFYLNPNNMACCGRMAYHRSSALCCNRRIIHTNPNGRRCCGSSVCRRGK